ncbi:MAG: hypothetical protein U0797_13800 [Gemmataceae bacterium]
MLRSATLMLSATALLTLSGCQTWEASNETTLPSPRYLQHPPQYIPPSSPFPLQRELAAMQSVAVPTTSGSAPPAAPGTPSPPAFSGPAGPGSPATTPPSGGPIPNPNVGPGPQPATAGAMIGALIGSALPSKPTPAATAKKAILTVANVRGEPIKLFTVNSQGELAFLAELPTGEAVDVATTVGARLAAVFNSEPHSQSFRVGAETSVWLLRGTGAKKVALPKVPEMTFSSR